MKYIPIISICIEKTSICRNYPCFCKYTLEYALSALLSTACRIPIASAFYIYIHIHIYTHMFTFVNVLT